MDIKNGSDLFGMVAKRVVKPVKFKLGEQECTIHVREVTGLEREAYIDKVHAATSNGGRLDNSNSVLVWLYACDGAGNQLFVEADLPRICNLPVAVIDTIATAGLELNKLYPNALDEAVKNSTAVPTGG